MTSACATIIPKSLASLGTDRNSSLLSFIITQTLIQIDADDSSLIPKIVLDGIELHQIHFKSILINYPFLLARISFSANKDINSYSL